MTEELQRQVRRWADAGMIGRDQADAILAMEGAAGAAGGRRAVVVEILGYVGGGLALVAGIVLGAESWTQLGRPRRMVVLAAVTAALLGAGWRLRAGHGRVLPRLASVLWMAAVAAFAGLLAVAVDGPGDGVLDDPSLAVAAGSLLLAGGLWAVERRVLQQVALFVAAVATMVAAGEGLGWSWETVEGYGFLVLGAAWLELGRRGLLPPRRTSEALGAFAVVSGPEVLYGGVSKGWAIALGLAVALALLVAGSAQRRTVLLGFGAAALVLFLSQVAAEYWRSLGAPLAILAVGLGLVAVAVALARVRPGGPGAAQAPRRNCGPSARTSPSGSARSRW